MSEGTGFRLEDVLADLAEDGPVHLLPDERLFKLYIFRPAEGRATRLEHRIYSKIKPNGKLALVTFAVHRPTGDQAARSKVAQVPELSPEHLDHIIDTIRRQTNTGAGEYDEVDLSHLPTLAEQIEYLRELAQGGRASCS